MTLEQLRVLQAIVQTGTFRGAGERLFKSQPAVSVLIRKLEEELGLKLFTRATYRPELTAEGRVIHDQAVIALKETNKLSALAQRLTGKEEPEVRLSVNSMFPLTRLLKTLQRIDADHPATRLIVTGDSMGGSMDRLMRGETDIALTTETDMDSTRMEARSLAMVRVVPVARPDYGPATREGCNTVEDVRRDVQVVVADSSVSENKQSLDLVADARRWTVTDMAVKKDIIMAGMGWGGLPEHLVAEELASGKLVRVYVEGFDIRESQLYILRRTDRSIGVVAEALWQALDDWIADP